jgi:uncharacterized membrane protein
VRWFLRPDGSGRKGRAPNPVELNKASRSVRPTRPGDIELGHEAFLIDSGRSEKGSTRETAKPPSRLRFSLPAGFCVLAILALGFALQINAVEKSKALLAVTLSIGCTGLATTCRRVAVVVPALRAKHRLLSFLVVIGVFNLLAMVAFRAHQDPIDVIEFEVDSVHALLLGNNPYGSGVTHQDLCYGHEELCHGAQFYGPGVSTEGRVHVGFPYPPLALFWTIPGYLLHNVRYAWLLAINLATVLIFWISPDVNGLLAAVLLLFGAPTINVLSHGYTEPLLLLTLATVVLVAQKEPGLLPLALGLFLASKQYSLLALPLAALLLPRFSWKKYLSMIGIAVGVALLLALPFGVSDPHGFWWSLVTFQTLAPLRPDALSFSALLVEHGSRPIPQGLIALITILVTAMVLWKAPRTPSAFALSLALLSLIFFVLNKQAFANYYFFCLGTLCVGLAASAGEGNCDFTLVRYQHE